MLDCDPIRQTSSKCCREHIVNTFNPSVNLNASPTQMQSNSSDSRCSLSCFEHTSVMINVNNGLRRGSMAVSASLARSAEKPDGNSHCI